MYDATCQRIREVAEEARLPLPDALRPEAIPGPKQMYHVNLSGGGLCFGGLFRMSKRQPVGRGSFGRADAWRVFRSGFAHLLGSFDGLSADAHLANRTLSAVFRSTVDVWGISQVFPVMPIHR